MRILNVLHGINGQLIQFLGELKHLKHITLEHSFFASSIHPEVIRQIIEHHDRLEQLQLKGYHLNQNEVDHLREEFQDDWNIIAHYYEQQSKKAVDVSFVKMI